MRACVYVCVQSSQLGSGGVGGRGVGAGDAGIISSPFIDYNKRPKKGHVLLFHYTQPSTISLLRVYCIKYRVSFRLVCVLVTAFIICHLYRWVLQGQQHKKGRRVEKNPSMLSPTPPYKNVGDKEKKGPLEALQMLKGMLSVINVWGGRVGEDAGVCRCYFLFFFKGRGGACPTSLVTIVTVHVRQEREPRVMRGGR